MTVPTPSLTTTSKLAVWMVLESEVTEAVNHAQVVAARQTKHSANPNMEGSSKRRRLCSFFSEGFRRKMNLFRGMHLLLQDFASQQSKGTSITYAL